MKQELTQTETLTLRDYIDKEMTKLHEHCLGLFQDDDAEDNLSDIMCENARMIALQEIVYRLEYGFITEIGDTSLKHHLPRI